MATMMDDTVEMRMHAMRIIGFIEGRRFLDGSAQMEEEARGLESAYKKMAADIVENGSVDLPLPPCTIVSAMWLRVTMQFAQKPRLAGFSTLEKQTAYILNFVAEFVYDGIRSITHTGEPNG